MIVRMLILLPIVLIVLWNLGKAMQEPGTSDWFQSLLAFATVLGWLYIAASATQT